MMHLDENRKSILELEPDNQVSLKLNLQLLTPLVHSCNITILKACTYFLISLQGTSFWASSCTNFTEFSILFLTRVRDKGFDEIHRYISVLLRCHQDTKIVNLM